MNAYQQALWNALLAGFYVPELVDCYYREDDFKEPHCFVVEV